MCVFVCMCVCMCARAWAFSVFAWQFKYVNICTDNYKNLNIQYIKLTCIFLYLATYVITKFSKTDSLY